MGMEIIVTYIFIQRAVMLDFFGQSLGTLDSEFIIPKGGGGAKLTFKRASAAGLAKNGFK
jgi:hypothetical protein